MHALFLFDGKAPYISNDTISQIWGHGFTKTKSLKGIGNPGLYLTAYLGDMELSEAISSGMTRGRLAEVEAKDEQGCYAILFCIVQYCVAFSVGIIHIIQC